MNLYCFLVNYLFIKTGIACNAGNPASLQSLPRSTAAWDSGRSLDSSSDTKVPSKEGTTGQDG